MSKASAKAIIAQANAWMGLKESNGSHKKIIDIYNGHTPLAIGYKVKYTDSWCSTFVSAVAIKCDATDIIPTECGCERQIKLFQKIGSWVEKDSKKPELGDIIFYDWDDRSSGDNTGWSDHVGIVTAVGSSTFTVIEGNYSNSVKKRTMGIDGKYIRGYGVPKYGEAIEQIVTADFAISNKVDALDIDGRFGPKTVKKLQEVLGTTQDGVVSNQSVFSKKYHQSYSTSAWEFNDSNKGSQVIKAWQKYLNKTIGSTLTLDGKCGPLTIKAIQELVGVAEDGYMGKITVKAVQVWLNEFE